MSQNIKEILGRITPEMQGYQAKYEIGKKIVENVVNLAEDEGWLPHGVGESRDAQQVPSNESITKPMPTRDQDMNSIPSIGQVVRSWRQSEGLSVTQFSDIVGRPVDKAYISKLEHGKIRMPSERNIKRIARGLGIPEEYLLLRRLPDQSSR